MYIKILRRINTFDNYILYSIKKYIENKYLDKLMIIATSLGNLGIVWIIMALILILNKPYRLIGFIVLLTLIISTIIGEGIIKHIVRRNRPFNFKPNASLLIAKPLSYSFPSGHTLSSVAVAEVLSIYLGQYKLIFMAIAFLIALSRVYLYVHYPTDIIAGIIIGTLCSKLILTILQINFVENIILFYKNLF